ncbi:hypothetical protein [Falsirhodobacter sp. 20TX0035]|uniref:hypothetical protein n=1 Tax=Falsirhodobacter sp. 20TX0035 TaxID=3022019 RepID=UPI00232EA6CC|nr:hypothetical protein [Falsirhodobacter sp. 20TX0035]MDB6454464.1 hypothetical protein [Falsirhodobacter sp. 20TX0035]
MLAGQLMPRNMIAANVVIFELLDVAVSSGGSKIPNSGSKRWISTTPSERGFLRDARLVHLMKIGAKRLILNFEYQQHSYFATIGFSGIFETKYFEELQVNSSHLTAILSEANIPPSASPLEIIENIGGHDKDSDPDYNGHDAKLLFDLYPKIKVFRSANGIVADFWQAYFIICLEETIATGSWISQNLFESLTTMSELDSTRIPYSVLCRSIFDHDQSSLFLAMYRCIEALYSYTATISLMASLGIKSNWKTVSKQLELDLKWHPREDAALQGLFKKVGRKEIDDISSAIFVEAEPKDTYVARVARAVYDLRNKTVHYRPVHQEADIQDIDWGKLCSAMSCVILDVYNESL